MSSVSIGAGATSLTVDTHAGRMLYHNVAGAATLTLPAINSSSDSGVAEQVMIQTQRTIKVILLKYTDWNNFKVGDFGLQVANASDTMTGKRSYC